MRLWSSLRWTTFNRYLLVAPHSLVVKALDDLRNAISRDDSYLPDSQNLAFVLYAKQLLFRKWTRVCFLFATCVRFSWSWHTLIPIFPSLEKPFPFLCPFGLNFKVLRKSYTSHSLGKASFPYTLMVGFEFLSQECPSVSFFFARLGVFLEYSSGWRPQVGLFVSYFSTLRPILLSIYPLIRQSLIKHHSELAIIEYRDDIMLGQVSWWQDCLPMWSLWVR